jgi:hypothetical protein
MWYDETIKQSTMDSHTIFYKTFLGTACIAVTLLQPLGNLVRKSLK